LTRVFLKNTTLALLGCACTLMATSAEPPPPKVVAYLGATLIDGVSGVPRPNMAIVTRGERISLIVPLSDFHAEPGQDIVQVADRYIVPGLINTHVHLATLADPPVAKAYLRRELYSGVTTVRDMAGDVRLLSELKREADFGEIVSPDIYYVALMAGPEFFVDPRTHDSARGRVAGQVPWMQAITTTTNLPLAIAEARGTGATAIKLYADLPAALVKSITEEAHRQQLLVWAHAAVFPALPSDVVDAGVNVISHACLLGYETTSPPLLSYEDPRPVDANKAMHPNEKMSSLLASMKRHGTILDATLNIYDTGPPSKSCPDGVADFLARAAFRAGIAISAGTDDDPDWSKPDSVLDEEIGLLVDRVGMSPAEALRAATLIGARTLGLEKDAGTLEVGKLANLVVLRRNPLENIANLKTVDLVVKRGSRYPRNNYQPATEKDFPAGADAHSGGR
jgi:imidazolonepropionase-like amidohydrolase